MGDERNPLYYSCVREDLIRFIPSGAKRILEVGCAEGKTGESLRQKGFEEIVGIEVNGEVAKRGSRYYNSLIIGDVERIRLPFGEGHFDCILYGRTGASS